LGTRREWPKLRAITIYILLRWATLRDPALCRAPIAPSVRPLPLSVGHPCTHRQALVRLRQAPVHPLLGTRPSVRLPYSPIGYRGPPSSLRRATPSSPPSDIEFFSSASLLTAIFIHFPESSSTVQKMHPLSKKLIHC
jgi:hypothetical protein